MQKLKKMYAKAADIDVFETVEKAGHHELVSDNYF